MIRKDILLGAFCLTAAISFTAIADAETKIQEETARQHAETATKSDASTNSMAEQQDCSVSEYTGFFTDDKGKQYFESGKPRKGSFLFVMGELYHAGDDGYLSTGWYRSDQGLWYYFDDAGAAQEGWIQNGGIWYYLDNYDYKTGWAEIADEAGNTAWYYFDESGQMLADCRTPDGYYVGPDGSWQEDTPMAYEGEGFEWDKPTDGGPGQISGLQIADMPAEFYMLSIAGEVSGMSNINAIVNGDKGRAYGICQFDYRYDLVRFMNYAYDKHPELWPGFEGFLGFENGDEKLCNNPVIAETFVKTMQTDYETAVCDQLEFVRIHYWDSFKDQMNNAGFNLDGRHIAVSAALLSVKVNCGTQAGTFINNLSPDMSDEEMIRGIYKIRNTILAEQYVGSVKKGTSTRYLKSEPQMALDLLYGYTTIDSVVNYGGGVEWHGNPFVDAITTIELTGAILYQETESAAATPSEATASDAN